VGDRSLRRGWTVLAAVLAALAVLAGACSSDDGEDDSSGSGSAAGADGVIEVPQEVETIQGAVDVAKEGDLILVDKGIYHEAVDVDVPDITIRGVDRNEVILDGEFELENGIRVLDTDGVVVENMTARNYVSNGFFWTGSDRYRGSYLTAYRNGDYGIYAFDAYHGQIDHSYASGSPDAGFYIGECFRCDAVISEVVSEYNGLGYSGTNSGGDLYIVNSVFRNNRAGIVPNSGSYELCYPSRETVIAGNLVHDNNMTDGPGIDVSLLAQGNGILPAGAVRATITKNRVWNHARTGIGLVPFPESDANDLAPAESDWDAPCSETPAKAEGAQPSIPADRCVEVEIIGDGCVVIWNPIGNRVEGNDVSGSGVADLAVGTVDLTGSGQTTDTLRNCFSDNVFSTSAPANLEQLAPCSGEPTATDWEASPLNLIELMDSPAAKPTADAYKTTPVPGPQENMPNARTAKAVKFTTPMAVDVASIQMPPAPTGG
jgi:hypothetical protein